MITLWLARFRPAAFLLLLVPAIVIPSGHTLAQLSVNVVTAPVNTLSIADVDFENATTPKWLFTVTVFSSSGKLMATMEATLDVFLSSGENFPNAVYLKTKPFEVPLTFTNLDIGKGKIERDIYTFDPAAKHRFQDVAFPSGSMPAGKYRFTILVTSVISGQSDTKSFIITLTNPSAVSLIFPMDGDASISQFPLFQWRYDGPSSRISVFEKLPNQGSLEEAAQGVPTLTSDVQATSFQYPSAAVRALQPGKTYVWFVEGLSGMTGGTSQSIRSELRSFTVSSAGASSFMTYLDDLERALDPKYKPIFDRIRAEGLLATGTIKLNGNPISTVELLKIIQQLRANPDGVLSVGLDQ